MAGQDDSPAKAAPAQPDRPGSLANLVPEDPTLSFARSFPAPARVKFLILAGLVVLLNWWQFPNLVHSWLHDPNWGHGFVIPLFSLYLLYQRWGELLAAPRRVCLGGLSILVAGVLAMILCFYPIGILWACQLSMTVVAFGLILYLAGPRMAALTWLPVFYLTLAMPVPERIYRQIANPLQELAAVASGLLLGLFGAHVDVTASHLTVTSVSGQVYPLNVIEACSGVRSLLAYLALGVAWAYLEYRPIWQRVALVASAVPIAVLCNILRVTVTCSMFVADRPEMGQEFMHWFMGMVMLAPALLLFFLLSWLLGNLFVEEPAPAKEKAA